MPVSSLNSTASLWRQVEVTVDRFCRGFSLMEVLIAVFLSSLLITGIVQLVAGSVSAYRLQLSQSHLEESGHYARDVLVSHISQAGFQAEPWNVLSSMPAVTSDSIEDFAAGSDQLGLQRWSRRIMPYSSAEIMGSYTMRMAVVHNNPSPKINTVAFRRTDHPCRDRN